MSEAEPMVRDGAIHGRSPADEAELEPVETTKIADLRGIVGEVRAAAELHAARPIEERVRLLGKFRDAVLARGEALVAALKKEQGKPEAESWLAEVVPTADLAAFWGEEGPTLLAAHEPELDPISFPGKRAVVERAPRGVIALITPWNFPVAIPLRTLFPALLAGNGVVMKPSEYAPRSARLIEEAAREAFGKDLVRLVQGGGDVGAALIGAGVDAVVFTGSVATGKKVAHAAAEVLIPAGLELGGKDAAIVLDDADVERAARGVLWGAMTNAGQNCAAIERVYVTPGIAKAFRDRLVVLAKELVSGRDVGPLATAAQLAVVERHVRAAKDAGAEVLAGGERLDQKGLWFAPTVLGKVPAENESIVDETFGPVIPVLEVKDEEAAITAANESRYGLTASVWTKDLARGERIARRLRAGVVTINNHAFTGAVPSLPWTGVRDSGYGVTNSSHALDVLARPRVVLVDHSRGKRELWWYPYTGALVNIGRAMATLRGGAGFGAKVKAFFALLGAFMKRWKP